MSDWYYAEDNTQKGPVLELELKALLSSGKLAPDSLVWKEGMANWTAARDVPALSAAPVVSSATSTPNPASITPVTTSEIIGTPEALEVSVDDAEKYKIFGIIAYLSFLCLVPLVVAKDSPFAAYHARQGFTLAVLGAALFIVGIILGFMAYFILPHGVNIVGLVLDAAWLGILVLTIMGIINAARGKCLPLPLIGGIKLIK